jgi:hypothetical protein
MKLDLTQIIITLIQLIIAPLAIWLTKEAVGYLKAKAVAISDATAHERVLHYLDLAAAAIETAVAETQQTFVSTIKHTDGWSAATAQEAYQRSRDKAIEIMGQATYAGLAEAVGDVNQWINARIEAAVLANRKAAG